MKHFKKTLALFLIAVMSLSLTGGNLKIKAATTISVTLRIEQDSQTMVTPITITLTDKDKRDFGIQLPTDKLTPMHALAKYMETQKGETPATMRKYLDYSVSQYGGFLSGISLDGTFNSSGNASVISGDTNVYWMYTANNKSPIDSSTGFGYASDGYPLKNNDSLVFYGSYYSTEPVNYYATFDKTRYDASVGKPLSMTLYGLAGSDTSGQPAKTAISDATILVSKYDTKAPSGATTGSAISAYTVKTNKKGVANITFSSAGLYAVSAYKTAPDGIHQLISRPFALVNVIGALGSIPVDLEKPTISLKPGKKLAAPTGLKAKITKKKKKQKTITLSWKRVKKAKGYRVYISRQKKKGYKKLIDTKRLKATWKRKAGTYYVKIRAYKKNKKSLGKYSKVLTIKVPK